MPPLDVDLGSGAGQPTPPREPSLARVLNALRGLGERRALVALLCAALGGTLVGGILTVAVSIFGEFVAVLAGLVVALALAAGVHAAGLLQMDAERGIGQRSTADALAQGVQALPLLIGIGLAVVAAVAVVLVAVALLLALSRLPLLGPVLFAVVFPLSIVAVGATIAGATMALAFAMAALWQGASPMRALAQTLVVLRRRTVATLGRFVALGFVVAAAAGTVFGVLSLGFGPVAALAAGLVGGGPLGAGAAGFGAAAVVGGGGAHVAAGAIGSMLLWAAALSLVAQVWLRGVCGVYLDMSEGVDASASEALLRERVDEARRRASTATAGTPAPAGVAPPRPPEPPEDDLDRTRPVTAPPWEESTSPSASAVSTPTQFDRLRRAAFGDGTDGAAPASARAAVPPARTADAASPAPGSVPAPAAGTPSTATAAAAAPVVAALPPTADRTPLPRVAPQPPASTAPPPSATDAAGPGRPAAADAAAASDDDDDDTTLPPTGFGFAANAATTLPLFATAPDIDLPLDAPAAAAAPACPSCAADVSPDDLFCNRCGHRLRTA